jgi:hypothetical protein
MALGAELHSWKYRRVRLKSSSTSRLACRGLQFPAYDPARLKRFSPGWRGCSARGSRPTLPWGAAIPTRLPGHPGGLGCLLAERPDLHGADLGSESDLSAPDPA